MKDAWSRLKDLYEEPSTANKMRLYVMFLSSKMDINTSSRLHVEQFLLLSEVN